MTDKIVSIDPHDNLRKMLKRSNEKDFTKEQYKEKYNSTQEQLNINEQRYNELFDLWADSLGLTAKDWIEIGMDIAHLQHQHIGEEWRDVTMANFDSIVHKAVPRINKNYS